MKRKRNLDVLKYIGAFLLGSFALGFFSAFQKALLGLNPWATEPKGFIVPFLFGGFAGLFIAIFYFRLQKSQEQLADYLDHIDNLVQIVSADKRFLYVNKAWRDTLQYSPEEVKKLNLRDILPPERKSECDAIFERIFAGEHIGEFDTVFVAKDGTEIYLRGTSNGAHKNQPTQQTRGIFRNITADIEAEEFQRLSAQIFENTREGIFITNPDRSISWINTAFTKLSGYEIEDALGQDAKDFFLLENEANEIYEKIIHALRNGKNWQGEFWTRRKNGVLYPVEASISTVRSRFGKINHFICLFTDISERKNNEYHLEQMAWFDALTNLPNRINFHREIEKAIKESKKDKDGFAVFFLDLDGFKNINDRYGHAKGDELLKMVALRLRASLRQVDAVARLGGDEFGVLLKKVEERKNIYMVAQSISDKISAPYQIDKNEMTISASIGISLYPEHKTLDALINAADYAMYAAKSDPQDNIHFSKKD